MELNTSSSTFDWRRSTALRVTAVAVAVMVLVLVVRQGSGTDTDAPVAAPTSSTVPSSTVPDSAEPALPADGEATAPSPFGTWDPGASRDRLNDKLFGDGEPGSSDTGASGTAEADAVWFTPDWLEDGYELSLLCPVGWDCAPTDEANKVVVGLRGAAFTTIEIGPSAEDVDERIEIERQTAQEVLRDWQEESVEPIEVNGLSGYQLTGTFTDYGEPVSAEVRVLTDGSVLVVTATAVFLDGDADQDAATMAMVLDSLTTTERS